ncbi:MAG: glycosyltransferase family 4 protein [Rhodothermales bacterium]|nr:glycosyltransferase family 4 protein [Rhodothermales bacterium]
MRILVHDYAGHPFPFDLSRQLAQQGHDVCHMFCASLHTGPTGSFTRRPDDLPNFNLAPIKLSEPLDKFSFVKRWFQENEYGKLAARALSTFRPDVILSGNTPLDAQRRIWDAAGKAGARKVFWAQDLIGLATHRILRKKIPVLGSLIGTVYIRLEKKLLVQSDHVVVISDDFVPTLVDWKVPTESITVIENWAPINELPAHDRINPWSTSHGYDDKFVFMYTGTMGMKHNPELILELARHFANRPDIRIVVASAGLGAQWLEEQVSVRKLENLDIMGFHPFADLPEALASADALVAVLEADADVYSVPSKVLAYLCAGRPILLAVPEANLASRIVSDNEAGLASEPSDIQSFIRNSEIIFNDKEKRSSFGTNARRYAEQHFDIRRISRAFEEIFASALREEGSRADLRATHSITELTG